MNQSLQEEIRNSLSLYHPISEVTATALAEHTRLRQFRHGDIIEKENQTVLSELLVLDGVLRSFLIDNNGEDITTNFFQKGAAITPSLTRTLDGKAFHSLQVISPQASLLEFNKKGMSEFMGHFKDLEMFGYRVTMVDAFQRAEREVVMIKSNGKEKLAWFRKRFPGLENEIPHYFIASFLGMTPTSLSRLRGRK